MCHGTKQYTLDDAIRRGWRKLAESSEKFNNRGVSALHVAKYLLYFCGDFHTCILMFASYDVSAAKRGGGSPAFHFWESWGFAKVFPAGKTSQTALTSSEVKDYKTFYR